MKKFVKSKVKKIKINDQNYPNKRLIPNIRMKE